MIKIPLWITALQGLFVLMLIQGNLADNDNSSAPPTVHIREPTYQSAFTTMLGYNLAGSIHYTLVANQVNHVAKQQLTWFIRPVATTFDEKKGPNWTVQADKAKLIADKILYLYGHVQVASLSDAALFQYLKTDKAVVNLVTQEVYSNNQVTLYGTGFNSTGMKMRSNLRNKTTELIEHVETVYYEFEKSQSTPAAVGLQFAGKQPGCSSY